MKFWELCFLGTALRKRSYRRACDAYGIMDKFTEQIDGGGEVYVRKQLNIIDHVPNLSINIDSSYYMIHSFLCGRFTKQVFKIVL
jgi:hypothetical protein